MRMRAARNVVSWGCWVWGWTLLPLLVDAGPSGPLQPDPPHGAAARALVREFPRNHLTHRPFDDAMSRRVWTNYFTALDPERIYFLTDDLARFRQHEQTLDEELLDRNVHFAFDVFHVFRERVRDRVQYVQSWLQTPPDLQRPDTYRWQRKDAPWPVTTTEWNDLWDRRLRNEYLRLLLPRSETNTAVQASGPESTRPLAAPESPPPSPETVLQKRYQQFLTLLEDADADWVMDRFLNAVTHAYDPHSEYLSPSALEDFNIEMRLSLVGVGAVLTSEDGAAKVVRLIPGGPADRDKRLKPGDRIIEVAEGDGKPVDVLHWPLPKVVKLIRGKKGTRVVLTVIPASDPTGTTTRRIDLIRDEVKLEDEAARFTLREMETGTGQRRKLAILTLPAFYADMQAMSRRAGEFRSSTRDVEGILTTLSTQGVEGILLDLRNNGGGALMEAISMTGLFIPSGPVVQVQEGTSIRIWPDPDPRFVYRGPLVVLVNRLSASASEILAAALQDYGRALIVGDTKTHGKGTVQSLTDLGRNLGSAKITTACYYRITGSSTQLRGVSPDLILSSPYDAMEIGEEFLPNPLGWSQIPPAAFQRVTDPSFLVAELRRQSERRLANNPRYAAYREMLDRLRTLTRMAEVPLDLASRRQLAQIEQQLAEFQEQLALDRTGHDSPSEKPSADLVLEEALRILADWVDFASASPQTPR